MARKVRVRPIRVSGQEKLQQLVSPHYDETDPFTGMHIGLLYEKLKQGGYVACYKCNRPAHELDLFRRKLSVPRMMLEGVKVRAFFPVYKNYWVSLLHAWKEAGRNPESADAPERRKRFEELLTLASGKEFPMRIGLHNNDQIRGRIKVLVQQGVVYEQEELPLLELVSV